MFIYVYTVVLLPTSCGFYDVAVFVCIILCNFSLAARLLDINKVYLFTYLLTTRQLVHTRQVAAVVYGTCDCTAKFKLKTMRLTWKPSPMYLPQPTSGGTAQMAAQSHEAPMRTAERRAETE